MNTQKLFLLFGIWLAMQTHVLSQVASNATFTRITTGAIATDVAHSFGCAWGDYDGDGYLDLIVGNGLGDANALYHNNGDGTFTRIMTGPIATTIGDTDGVIWGDYDNDGDIDLFAANWQIRSFLFRNDGDGNFTRITNGSPVTNVGDSIGCSWGDYDNDGWLDLIVANYAGQNEFLYRNAADGTFAQVLTGPLVTSGGDSGVPLWADYDNDGMLDVIISSANVTSGENVLFHNDGNGNFARVNAPPTGFSAGGGLDWGDYDNDGDLDLYIAQHASGANDLLFRNDGGGVFTRITSGPVPTSGGHSQHGVWGDYDNDGWLDLFVVNYQAEPNFLFRNNGDGTFARIFTGEIVTIGGIRAGPIWGDYDNDGFLDMFIARGGEQGADSNLLFHNDGNSNHWLSVICAGRISNRSGIGAKVRVKATIGGRAFWQLRDISSGNGYSACRPRAHFGLGDATNAEIIRIEWPSGQVQELRNVSANQILTVKESPMLTMPRRNGPAGLQFTFKGGRGLPYTVESSTNFVHWSMLTNVTTTGTETRIEDSNTSSATARFYRVREVE